MPAAPKNHTIKHRAHEVTIPTPDGRSVAERIPIRVPMEWDAELGEWLLTPEAETMIEAAKARHMGLLLPQQLLELRQRLGLSQRAIGELLQIGAKSWTRWETGKQRPSRSLNLLLRALYSGLISPTQLSEMGTTHHDWSAQFCLLANQISQTTDPVSLDLCRQMQTTDPTRGASADPAELPA
jgi:DNA-binding transcriptional regulator YiaG